MTLRVEHDGHALNPDHIEAAAVLDERLEFPGHDGRSHVRVISGRKCVVVIVEPRGDRGALVRGSIVLVPDEARALGLRLIAQAELAERPYG